MRVCLFLSKIQKFLLKVFHIIEKIPILTYFQRGYRKIPLAHQSYSLQMITGVFSLSDFSLCPTPPPHMYICKYLIDVTYVMYISTFFFPKLVLQDLATEQKQQYIIFYICCSHLTACCGNLFIYQYISSSG